jgi:hypothetical protein
MYKKQVVRHLDDTWFVMPSVFRYRANVDPIVRDVIVQMDEVDNGFSVGTQPGGCVDCMLTGLSYMNACRILLMNVKVKSGSEG